jgi:hypothetical protein
MNRIERFLEQNYDGLLKVYIIERQKHNNDLGVLLTILDNENKQNTGYYPLSSDILSEEIKNEVIEKNNERNSMAFFCVIDKESGNSSLMVKDLD